jgi:hypothetical protein
VGYSQFRPVAWLCSLQLQFPFDRSSLSVSTEIPFLEVYCIHGWNDEELGTQNFNTSV